MTARTTAVLVSLLGSLIICGAAGAKPKDSPGAVAKPDATSKTRIVLVGDSTVTDPSGWGLGFARLLKPNAECINKARGGASSKSFYDKGNWKLALAEKPDYVLIQFGHNDQPGKGPERETDPKTTYREYLGRYVDDARAAGAEPILVTSLTRRIWGPDGKIRSSLVPYVEGMKAVATEKKVPLVDLHTASIALVEKLGPEKAKELGPPHPEKPNLVDGTHLNTRGADAFAPLIADELRAVVPALRECLPETDAKPEAKTSAEATKPTFGDLGDRFVDSLRKNDAAAFAACWVNAARMKEILAASGRTVGEREQKFLAERDQGVKKSFETLIDLLKKQGRLEEVKLVEVWHRGEIKERDGFKQVSMFRITIELSGQRYDVRVDDGLEDQGQWYFVDKVLGVDVGARRSAIRIKELPPQVVWNVDNLKSIGGHDVVVVGEPKVVEIDGVKGVEFDGKDDGLFVAANPLAGLTKFTVEVVFRPATGGPAAQRFLHFQPDGPEDRLLFETRLTPESRWFLDTYLKAGETNQTLFADKFPHPLDKWHTATITIDGDMMRHYVDGKEELSAKIQPAVLGKGQTSIGVRFNKVHWYQGAISRIRVTPDVLHPADFLKP